MDKDSEYTVVVDECVAAWACDAFLAFMQKQGFTCLKVLLVGEKHPGMPDGQILLHLLNERTIFLTEDRPLHNAVLAKKWISYYVDNGTFIGTKLKGIRPKTYLKNYPKAHVPKDTYHTEKIAIMDYLVPASEKTIKKLRTKRRRIRSYFDGVENIQSVAVTVSWKALKAKTLFGVRLRISATSGKKALDASENYFSETVPAERRDAFAYNYALMLLLQLKLHIVKTQVYYDAQKMGDPVKAFDPGEQGPEIGFLFAEMRAAFSSLEFIPSVKGPFIDAIRAKLHQLSTSKTNEIVVGNMGVISRNVSESSLPF